jgi:hypothetical protein
MNGRELHWFFILLLAAAALVMTPADMAGQGRGNRGQAEAQARGGSGVTLSVDARAQVRSFYQERGVTGVKSLPPGMRNRLAQGKPLPPGIAKQVAPQDLVGRLGLPRGFELLEVGLDVVMVEVATGVIHDVLMDVIR